MTEQNIDNVQEPDIEPVETDGAELPEGDSSPAEPKREWGADDEAEARAFGWKPKAEWQGRVPEGFIDDPRAYMDRAMTFKPFRTLKERMEGIESEYEKRVRKLEAISEKALATQRAQFQHQLDQITAQKRQAVEMADAKQYDRLEQAERAIREQLVAPQTAPQGPALPPETQAEITSYRASPDGEWLKNAQMFDIGRRLIDGNPEVMRQPPMEQVKWAERELRRMYPHYFTGTEPAKTERPAPRQVVDPGGLAGGKASDAFTGLPREAKDAFRRFVQQGLFTDDAKGREEYAREYNAA